MNIRKKHTGATLVISLIMLVVLTLLVVSAIRSGSTNLKITRNVQIKDETRAAAQQAIESVISGDFGDFTMNPNAQQVDIDMGPVTYQVVVNSPVCTDTVPMTLADLNPEDSNDQLCFSDLQAPPQIDEDGNQIWPKPKCNIQAWELKADAVDMDTGASTSVVQGLSRRTYLPTNC